MPWHLKEPSSALPCYSIYHRRSHTSAYHWEMTQAMRKTQPWNGGQTRCAEPVSEILGITGLWRTNTCTSWLSSNPYRTSQTRIHSSSATLVNEETMREEPKYPTSSPTRHHSASTGRRYLSQSGSETSLPGNCSLTRYSSPSK